eukprot:3723837-Amphidinium_carterae.1
MRTSLHHRQDSHIDGHYNNTGTCLDVPKVAKTLSVLLRFHYLSIQRMLKRDLPQLLNYDISDVIALLLAPYLSSPNASKDADCAM